MMQARGGNTRLLVQLLPHKGSSITVRPVNREQQDL